jgi:hypothetical protein
MYLLNTRNISPMNPSGVQEARLMTPPAWQARTKIDGLAQQFGLENDSGGNDRKVAAGPGCLLSLLDGGEIRRNDGQLFGRRTARNGKHGCLPGKNS